MQAIAADTVAKARAEVTRRITALGRQGKPKQAISELTNLARMGIQPDTQAATALVSACTANKNMDMAFNVFDELFGAPRPGASTRPSPLPCPLCLMQTCRIPVIDA
jgi:hypothetical protein